MDRNFVPERSYSTVGRGQTATRGSAPSAASASDDYRLTPGSSLCIVMLSSLGLWVAIWAAYTYLTSAGLN